MAGYEVGYEAGHEAGHDYETNQKVNNKKRTLEYFKEQAAIIPSYKRSGTPDATSPPSKRQNTTIIAEYEYEESRYGLIVLRRCGNE